MSTGDENMGQRESSISERLRKWFESEKLKIGGLTPGKKAQYILEYYWLWIIGILSAVIIPVYILWHAAFAIKDYWFYGMFANTRVNGGNESDLWYDFVEYGGFNTKEKKVEMNSSSFFDPSVSGGTNNSYFQAYVALTEAGDLDVVTLGREGLEALGSSGRLMDLSTPEADALREKYEDRFVYSLPNDEAYSTEPVPVGIDVSDSLLVTKYHLYEGDCVLGISAYSERVEAAELFLEFIL